MDKETLSNYGWVVICVLVLAVMMALATPFGSYVRNAVKSSTDGLFGASQNAMNTVGINIGNPGWSGNGTGEGSNGGAEETPSDNDSYYNTFYAIPEEGIGGIFTEDGGLYFVERREEIWFATDYLTADDITAMNITPEFSDDFSTVTVQGFGTFQKQKTSLHGAYFDQAYTSDADAPDDPSVEGPDRLSLINHNNEVIVVIALTEENDIYGYQEITDFTASPHNYIFFNNNTALAFVSIDGEHLYIDGLILHRDAKTTSKNDFGILGETAVPGLYKNGTMTKSWSQLLDEGIIHIDNGIVYTIGGEDGWTNLSSDALDGDLILPNDGTIVAIGDFVCAEQGDGTGRFGFTQCKKLTSITLPFSVKQISDEAFMGCNALHTINIQQKTTYIGRLAFMYCTSLENINYGGTVAEWISATKNALSLEVSPSTWIYGVIATYAKCKDGNGRLS